MKRISLIILAVLALALLSFTYSRTRKSNGDTVASMPQPRGSTDKALMTQRRLNRYFHSDVIPKLRNCWKRLQGEGTIEIKITYMKTKSNWTWESLAVDSSNLPRGQDAVASRCLEEAVHGTSFPVETGAGAANMKESVAKRFVVNWSWPVPLPANSAAYAEFRKAKGGGKTGGCDGYGTPAKCWTCSNFNCVKVCVGNNPPCKSGGGVCIEEDDPCASGGPFGGVGGVIMY